MKPRLLIVTSHPIQYQAPWFRALHADGRLALQVLFLSLPDAHQQGVGFGHAFEWDVPLLEGYRWAKAPSATGGIREGWWGLRLGSAAKDLSAHAPDAVLITGWQNRGMLQCLRAARRLKLPVLLRAESNGLAPLGTARRLKNRWIAGHAQQLLPIGRANRRFYQTLGLEGRIGPKVPYFVDNEFFAERSRQRRAQAAEVRSSFEIPETAFCLVFAGKLIPKKRAQDLLAALEHVQRELAKPVHLLVVGTGPLDAELRAQAGAADLSVTFAGFLNQTEMPAAYAAADCLVLASDYGETWGLVINEGMACGLPAIVSDRVGCGPDLVTDGETGFIFRFADIDHLSRRLAEMANLAEPERRAMGERARERLFTHYSIERAVENTVTATLALARGRNEGAAH